MTQSHVTDQFLVDSAASAEPYDFETVTPASDTIGSYCPDAEPLERSLELTRFKSQFIGSMVMLADGQTVARYLDAHGDWFCRCAQPMQVQPLGTNGYDLTIGHFGAFGYEVEPGIGLELLPQDQGVYRIRTIPTPHLGLEPYQVDFQAALQLVEVSDTSWPKSTQVEWQLELAVDVQFPKFIQKLPKRLIQSTGDRLLAQIVRQVSHRLTAKVQADFHTSLGLPLPPQFRRQ